MITIAFYLIVFFVGVYGARLPMHRVDIDKVVRGNRVIRDFHGDTRAARSFYRALFES